MKINAKWNVYSEQWSLEIERERKNAHIIIKIQISSDEKCHTTLKVL